MSEGRKEGRTWGVTEEEGLWEIREALQVGCYLSIYFFLILAHLLTYSNSDYMWNEWMMVNNEFDRMGKEVVIV
jgi:hypothetical protein